ncbi:MAG TPA: hypothetical protein V6D47_08985 [Oscillatoriaceae cyanobacterium]
MQLIRDLFWFDLAATLVMAYRGVRQWQAYQRAQATRGQMVGTIWTTLGLGVSSAALLVLSLL